MKPVFFSAPERCVSRDDALVDRLVELWEASVRATHDFLSEEDIRGIRTYVPDALRSIADLRIVRDAEGVPVAFMGCDGRRLEMLFVGPACRGAGVGTALVREAFAAGVTEVVVNEQNPSARGFYEHVGFAVCGRSERDETRDEVGQRHFDNEPKHGRESLLQGSKNGEKRLRGRGVGGRLVENA